MGTIITTTDLTNAIGNDRLSLLAPGTGGSVSTSIVNVMIGYGEAEANSILGPGFSVPIATAAVQTVVKRCTVDITVHFLYQRTTEFLRPDGNTPAYRRFEEARKTLTEIREGKRTMGTTAATSRSGITGGVVYYSAQDFILEDTESTTGPTGGF
jgi:hypothetical protein